MSAASIHSNGFPPGLRVVALGGGTGLPVVLRALKNSLADCGGSLIGIVTVSDDGGSSGRLRRHYNALPMGDIRNCLVALSGNETLMGRMFQYRYRGDRGIGGHALGNLILTALADFQGSDLKAIEICGQVLAIRGRILPATLQRVGLRAWLADGRRVHGETRISRSAAPIDRIQMRPAHPEAAPGVLAALREADLILLGPGSLYTSIIPNLLVRGVAGAIARSRAARVLVGNLMTQPGETGGYRPVDHLRAIERASRCGLVDYYLANIRAIRPTLRRRYAREGAAPVPAADARTLLDHGVVLVERDLVREDPDVPKVRHHERKLARALLAVLKMHAVRRAVA